MIFENTIKRLRKAFNDWYLEGIKENYKPLMWTAVVIVLLTYAILIYLYIFNCEEKTGKISVLIFFSVARNYSNHFDLDLRWKDGKRALIDYFIN